MKSRILLAMLVAGALAGIASLAAADASFKIVVNEGRSDSPMKRADLSAIFLKKKVALADGTKVVPVDLPVASPVREAFSIAVHGRKSEAIDVFWSRQLFSGRGVPPQTLRTSEEVIAHLQANPDAIAYVDGDAALPAGIQVLPLSD